MNTLREINFSKHSIITDEKFVYLVDKEGNVTIKFMLEDIKAAFRFFIFIMRVLKEEKKN